MKLAVCLGNPGAGYADTRHNAGFMFADVLAERLGSDFSNEPKFKAHILKASYNSETLLAAKPQTYMNLSGEAVSLIKNFYKIETKDIIIIYDDISLDAGRIRFRPNGSDGGHNGIKSIIKYLGTQQFDRLKTGIGPQPAFMKSEDYVLQKFTSEQREIIDETIKRAADAFLYYLEFGMEKTQNKYNN